MKRQNEKNSQGKLFTPEELWEGSVGQRVCRALIARADEVAKKRQEKTHISFSIKDAFIKLNQLKNNETKSNTQPKGVE
jgi:hypothetical protein